MKKLLVLVLVLALCLSLAAAVFADGDVDSPEENPLTDVPGGGLPGAVSPQTGVADYTPAVCAAAVAALVLFFGSVVWLKMAH